MKTKNLLKILILFLISCNENQFIINENLESSSWFDKFGNEYKFENNKLRTKPYFGQIWWESGKYKLQNNLFTLACEQDSTKEFISEIISIKEDKITFKNSIESCLTSISENKQRKEFELWKDLEQIRDTEEMLYSLKLKVRPEFIFGGIRNFNLYKDKKVEIGFKNEESIDTIFFLNDIILNQIETLIQVLPLEEYNDKYDFAIIDGANFEIELVTNKISKKINCEGMLPEGLNNLYEYIDFKLK